MELYLDNTGLQIYKALASDTRLEILKLLANAPATTSELAKSLNLSKAILSRHLKILEDSKLIHISHNYSSSDNRKKVYTLKVDQIRVNFPKRIYLPFQKKTSEIRLGFFSDFSVTPTCGLSSPTEVIGDIDDPRSFVSNDRINASLLWFSEGYVEYKIPNLLESHQKPELLELSLEISSEFPVSNNNWHSDITFYINDIDIGTWTCPGNYSDVRGKYTPEWWSSDFSQYGLLKNLRVNQFDTTIDSHEISDVRLEDLHLENSPFITLRIGVKPDAVNPGGVTIFGSEFGNHDQNILLSVYYSEENDNPK